MKEFKVALIGAGGLGVSSALHLSEHWPKNHTPLLSLTIYDHDRIELSNLNRQILFEEKDLGKQKSKILSERLSSRFNNIEYKHSDELINTENISKELSSFSFVIDATDCPITKFLINDFCVTEYIPFSYAGVVGKYGQSFLNAPNEQNESSCLRCLFGNLSDEEIYKTNDSCQTAGIIGVVAGKVSLIQINQVLEYLFNGKTSNELKRFDFENNSSRDFPLHNSKECPFHLEHQKLKSLDLKPKECPQTFILSKLGVEQNPKGLLITFSSYEALEKTSISLRKEKITTRFLRGNNDSWTLFAREANV